MPLETGTTIEDLDGLWPLGGDAILQGDDHIRLIKSVLKNIFPGEGGLGFSKPITATEDELNAFGADLGSKFNVDASNGPITGNLIVSLAGAIDSILALRNGTAGLDLLTRGDGNIVLGSTDAAGTNPQDEIVIDPGTSTIINSSGAERLRVDAAGGDLSDVWRSLTASPGTNSTQIATTAYADAAVDVVSNVSYVVETNNNANGYYRKYSDGYIEQWGLVTTGADATVVLPIAFIDLPSVTVVMEGMFNSHAGGANTAPVLIDKPTLTQFKVGMGGTGGDHFGWQAKGY